MLESILGTKTRELILQYVNCFESGYAREIAKYLNLSLPSVQKQLNNLWPLEINSNLLNRENLMNCLPVVLEKI